MQRCSRKTRSSLPGIRLLLFMLPALFLLILLPAATLWAANTTPITSTSPEGVNITNAANLLDELGQHQAAQEIKAKLAAGGYSYGNIDGNAETDFASTNLRSTTGISTGFVHLAPAAQAQGNNFSFKLRLACLLFHENVHANQGYFNYRKNSFEPPAWTATINVEETWVAYASNGIPTNLWPGNDPTSAGRILSPQETFTLIQELKNYIREFRAGEGHDPYYGLDPKGPEVANLTSWETYLAAITPTYQAMANGTGAAASSGTSTAPPASGVTPGNADGANHTGGTSTPSTSQTNSAPEAGAAPKAEQPAAPGASTTPGTNPATTPGTNSNANPGTNPGTTPSTTPGAPPPQTPGGTQPSTRGTNLIPGNPLGQNPGGPANPFACTASVAITPELRSEGYNELVSDIVLSCSGTPPPPATNPTISIGFNAPFLNPGQIQLVNPVIPGLPTLPGTPSGTNTIQFPIGPLSNPSNQGGLPTITGPGGRIIRITNVRVNATSLSDGTPLQGTIGGSSGVKVTPNNFSLSFSDAFPTAFKTRINAPVTLNPPASAPAPSSNPGAQRCEVSFYVPRATIGLEPTNPLSLGSIGVTCNGTPPTNPPPSMTLNFGDTSIANPGQIQLNGFPGAPVVPGVLNNNTIQFPLTLPSGLGVLPTGPNVFTISGLVIAPPVDSQFPLHVPRFIDVQTSCSPSSIAICQTSLLFPFITNTNGFDTGLAIANTSTDPFAPPEPATGSPPLNLLPSYMLNGTNTALTGNLIPEIQNIGISLPASPSLGTKNLRIPSGDSRAAARTNSRPDVARIELVSLSTSDSLWTFSPRALRGAFPNQDAKGAGSGKLMYSLVANGNSSGQALELQVFDPSGGVKDADIPEGLVLEPVKRGSAKSVEELQRGASMLRKPLVAYCVEYMKLPPEAGMLYRLAPPAAQSKFSAIRPVLQAGRELAAAGKLHPDSDPQAYMDSIRQYSLWAQIEHWNEQQFGQVFLEKTKENAAAAKVKWTKQMDQALNGLVPGRWRDISMVLDEAAKLSKGSPGQSPH